MQYAICICITTLHDCITVEEAEEAGDDDDVAPELSLPTAATVPQDVPSRRYPEFEKSTRIPQGLYLVLIGSWKIV